MTLNPVPKSKNCDFICFTNEQLPPVAGWEIRLVACVLPMDLPRSSRHPKAMPHLYLEGYSKSLYVDSSVLLLGDPRAFWRFLMRTKKSILGAFAHSFHSTLAQEFAVVGELGYDKLSILQDQLEDHSAQIPEYVDLKPIWGGIIARKHLEQDCKTAMEIWFANICRFSRRDQLSLPLAIFGLAESKVEIATASIQSSAFHEWPRGGFQKSSSYPFHVDD